MMRQLLVNALLSWQNATIIALAIIFYFLGLAPFSWWNPLFWLGFAVIGVAIFTVATLTDPRAQRQLLLDMLTERYNPSRIQNDGAKRRLKQALEYYDAIQKLTATRSGASRVEFQNTLIELERWLSQLFELAKRIDQFDENNLINRDRMQVRQELQTLEKRLQVESDPRVREALEESLKLKKTQLANLQSLEANIKRADIQMENTVTALGTTYAQMQNIGSKSIDNTRAQRLRNDIHEQVMSLQDTLSAIDEVQQAKV
jgi:hypothetical protein